MERGGEEEDTWFDAHGLRPDDIAITLSDWCDEHHASYHHCYIRWFSSFYPSSHLACSTHLHHPLVLPSRLPPSLFSLISLLLT